MHVAKIVIEILVAVGIGAGLFILGLLIGVVVGTNLEEKRQCNLRKGC